MKKVAVVVVVLVALVGCGTFEQTTYKTLYTAGQAYDVGMKTVNGLQQQGKITTDQRTAVNTYANVFYTTYQSAVQAFATWKQTGLAADKDKLATALAGVGATWATLASNVNRIVPNALQTSLEVGK